MRLRNLCLVAGALAASASMAGAASISVSESFSVPLFADGFGASYSFMVGASETITDLDITLDFTKCADPIVGAECVGTTNAYLDELYFELFSPMGTSVVLASRNTYDGSVGNRVHVTFDDDALWPVGGTELLSGAFQPVQSLGRLNGEDSQGLWRIFYADFSVGDPLTLNGYTLTISGEPPSVPLPASLPLLAAAIGGIGVMARRKRAA